MAVTANLVMQTTTGTGTGNLTLASALGFKTFATAFGTGATTDVFYYFITDQTNGAYEYGTGHMSDSTTLVRDTVIDSSNANALVNFSTGSKNVISDIPFGTGSGVAVMQDTPTITTPVINGTVTGTGVSTAPSTSTLIQRDANGNAYANNFIPSISSVTSAAGTTTLNANSPRIQILTGTTTQTFKLPSAATFAATGATFQFNNNSTGLMTINDGNNGLVTTVVAGGRVEVVCTDISTPAGVWDRHSLAPTNISWGTSALDAPSTDENIKSVSVVGTAGAGFVQLGAQASNPSAPSSGNVKVHAHTTSGITRVELVNESPTDSVVTRDSLFIVANSTGSTISKGKAVYINGASGGVPTVALARANSTSTSPAHYLVLDDILNGASGYAMRMGIINNVDTSAFTSGDALYLSTSTAGALQNTRPSGASTFVNRIGTVLISNASTGSIEVSITPINLGMETGTGTLVSGATGSGFTVDLGTSTVSGILGSVNGGTGNGFTKFSGAATSEKTYTLPNATCTILTSNAAVTVGQGGTGVQSTTAYGVILGGTTTTGAFQNAGAGLTGQTLRSNGASAVPSFQYDYVPQNSKSAAYTTVLSDAGGHIYHPSADTTARTWTIDSNANVAYPIGTVLMFVNDVSAGTVTISITSDTLVLAGTGATGNRTLAAGGLATALKVTSTRWIIQGTGLS